MHKAEGLDGNAVLPGTIREACKLISTPWGHVSSGCIYTERRDDGQGFTEDDTPNFGFRSNNCSWYFGCKALSEEVLDRSDNTYIWRLPIPLNNQDSPRNYLTKVVRYQRLLEAENSISHLGEFVSACLASWQKRIPFGTYNVTNTGHITTGQVTQWITQHLLPEKTYDFFETEAEFMKIAAKTPRSNCVTDNSKLLAAGIEMCSVEDAIIQSLQGWKASN